MIPLGKCLANPNLCFASTNSHFAPRKSTSLEAAEPSTSVKLPGAEGLRVDVLAPGSPLGATIELPALQWSAQAVPHYDYLLDAPEPAAALADGHCVPVRLPQAARLVWHKLYASTQRRGFPEKAAKDRQQAMVLGAMLAQTEPQALEEACESAPVAMVEPLRRIRPHLAEHARAHAPLSDLLERCLARRGRRTGRGRG